MRGRGAKSNLCCIQTLQNVDAGFIWGRAARREASVGFRREDQGQEREGGEKRWVVDVWVGGVVFGEALPSRMPC